MTKGQDLQDSGFARTGRILYQAVKDLNDGGEYFPLWTTCLGYELLFVLETQKFNFSRCNELDTLSNIGFVSDFGDLDSRIFAGVTKQDFDVSPDMTLSITRYDKTIQDHENRERDVQLSQMVCDERDL